MKFRLKKGLAFLLVFVLLFSMLPSCAMAANDDDETSWWKKLTGKLTDAATNAADTAETAVSSAKEVISKISFPDFQEGWEVASNFVGATAAEVMGQAYVQSVADAIDQLQQSVTNRVQTTGSTIASKAGNAAEEWHAGTYNIDAVASGKNANATVPESYGLGTADVVIGDDYQASMKYYKNAQASAKQQAKNYIEKYNEYAHTSKNPMSMDDWLASNNVDWNDISELYWSIYEDQVRVIPEDQLADAQKYLKQAIAKESQKDGANRGAVLETDLETLRNLTDRLETADGTQSIPLSKEEAEAIAKAGLNDDFNPRDFGAKTVTEATAIKSSYVAKQAIRGGATSAIIETAVVIGPQLYEIIKYLIETGELDSEQLKETGLEGLSAAADGFLKGSISNVLVVMCKAGKLGSAYTNASPDLIGALTVMTIDAIRYGIMMANGKMTTEDYATIMAEELIVSAASLGTAALVGMLFPGATLVICLGSFVGGLVASAGYSVAKTYVLAKIDDADIDMLVPIESTAVAIKDKTAEVVSKITDSISGIKDADISGLKGKTIEVFDLTTEWF